MFFCLFVLFFLTAIFFCILKKVFHVLGNRDIQTNVDKQLLDKFI